jgi:hypothetical protein
MATMSAVDFDQIGEGEAAQSDETNRERFVRIGERRTQQVLEKLRILGNCSNKAIYEYTEDDIEKIFRAILRQLDITRAQFEDRSNRSKFKL